MGALLTEAAPADAATVLALRSFKWSDWRVIWVAGGLCWLIAAVSQVLWALPLSGKTFLGKYYFISSDARLLQCLLVFVVAVFAYRLAGGCPPAHLFSSANMNPPLRTSSFTSSPVFCALRFNRVTKSLRLRA